MNDRLGRLLTNWRTRTVLPHVSGRLLDIGCGANCLVREYGNGVGVDVHDWGDVDLIVDDTAHLPLDDESFDTATIIAALNHIPNRAEVLREVYRVLRPAGRLIITMIPPRISAIWHFARRPWDDDQKERGMKPGEVYGLTHRAVLDLLRAAGFVPQRSQSFMFRLNRLTIAQKPSRPQPTTAAPAGAFAHV